MNKTPLLKKSGVQTFVSSLLCIIFGLVIGYMALLIINADGAGKAIMAVIKNFIN